MSKTNENESSQTIYHPIICRHCGKNTGYTQEQFMFCVLDHDVKCPQCNKIIIATTKYIW